MSAVALPLVDEALARASVYALITYGMSNPTEERMEVIHSLLLPVVAQLDLPPAVSAIVSRLAARGSDDIADLRRAHLLLFPPVVSQDAPGHETAYRGEDICQQVDLLADVAGFYRAHGFEPGGPERDRPDHILAEVEFMSLLCRKEALAIADGQDDSAQVCRDTQRVFLADHLACWASAFGRRMQRVVTHLWFADVGALLTAWVDLDAEALDAQPVMRANQPLPQSPPDDGECGPCVPGVGP